MEQTRFKYSMKNIPIPPRNSYLKKLIEKTESVIKRMRWKAFFFEKNDNKQSNDRRNNDSRELTNRRLHSRRRRLLLKILDTHAPPDVSSHQASSSERRRLHKALLEVVLARTRLEVCCDYFFLLFLSLPNTKFGT